MDIKQIYREETGLDVYRDNDAWNWEFSPEYVKWLEKQLTIPDVVVPKETFYCFSEAASDIRCKQQCLGCNIM